MHVGARMDIGPPPHFMTTGPLPVLGFGAWAVGGRDWGGGGGGSSPGDEHEATVRRALDRGITFFDTAPAYGDGASEALLGRVLASHRRDVTIATKVGPRDDPRGSLEGSLRRLATDYVDLLQLHEALDGWEGRLEVLSALRDEGKARAIGLCNASHLQLRRALEIAPITAYQGPFNLFDRDVEQRELPLCRERGLGFVAYRPLAAGLLSGKYPAAPSFAEGDHRSKIYWFKGREFERRRGVIERLRPVAEREGMALAALALAWVYSQPGVSVVLAGARSPAQVDQNLAGTRHLTPDTRAAIDRVVADAFRPGRATAECRAQASTWGERERFIVERLDGRTPYEAIAAAWTDRGEKPMIAAQIKVFVDQLADQGLTGDR
jgi:myo-inositol catabolism protein IolS